MKNLFIVLKALFVILCSVILLMIIINVEVVGKGIHWEANGYPQKHWTYMDDVIWDFDANLYDGVSRADFDCILVLGALVRSDGIMSNVLKYRCEAAAEAYFSGAGDKILLSGDHGQKNYDEVNTMKEYFLELGIPKEDIFLDHAGFSTYDSIVRAKEVFGAKRILIVTQEFHLHRSEYIARKIGIQAYGYKAKVPSYRWFLVMNEGREFVARCKDWLFVNFINPKPKYLGNPIDLNQSGVVTHDE